MTRRTDHENELNQLAKLARSNMKFFKEMMQKAEQHLEEFESKLHQLEVSQFLAANNATHLKEGVLLMPSESFYETQSKVNFDRNAVDSCYGRGLRLGYLDIKDGEFRVHSIDKSWTVGGIPLSVIQDMYEAAQKVAS